MKQSELNKLQNEIFEHLHKGRARLAFPLAEKLLKLRPNNSESTLCYAWACLENGDIVKAQYYTDLALQLEGDSILSKMYHGYLQMRLSNFEAAIYNFNMTEGKQKELLAWTYLNKAKSLASISEFEKSQSFFNLALMIDNNANPDWKNLKKYFKKIDLFSKKEKLNNSQIEELVLLGDTALKEKEFWFALIVSKVFLTELKIFSKYPQLFIMELEAMFRLNQYTLLEEKLNKLEPILGKNARYNFIKENVKKFKESKAEPFILNTNDEDSKTQTNIVKYENEFADILHFVLFDNLVESGQKKKSNLVKVNLQQTPELGLDIIFSNLFYKKESTMLKCFIAWYLEDDLLHQSSFNLEIPFDWEAVVINDICNTSKSRLWSKGNARIELFLNRIKVMEYRFQIGVKNELKEVKFENDDSITEKKINEGFSIAEALEELNKITGLNNVKKTVRELIDYIEFIKERKQLGLKAQDKICIHATFLGNPGTGKTTVARLMGKIFKGMGILEKGEVIEVDRSSLVGQYVGETAQKTQQILESAMGNVLFIDEAYTLVKKESPNDFGKEAIDTLLKTMEDKKDKFIVIAAGYPDLMNDFLEANPGLKSRFTHNFVFEDYDPNELMTIFNEMAKNEDYRIANSAEVMLTKEFTKLYRSRDNNFGNARTVRKIFENLKIQISKRYLSLPLHERSKEKLVTITESDINAVINYKQNKLAYGIPINEEMLNEALLELKKLTGLSSVKNEVSDMVKLAKYYNECGDNLSQKFSNHILFLGNPGTGKTTVARIVSRIYAALGILPKGNLVETDRKGLVANYVGQTADKTTGLINEAIGGTLFIDEAYSLHKGNEGDFGQEAIDTLLKRMEDDRGKFICIAAGYTGEMNQFLESNPGLKSRFTKSFNFEDYNPDELLVIFEKIAKQNKLKLDDPSKLLLEKYFNEQYRSRDKNFGNARLVRNLFDSISKKHSLRIMNLSPVESNNVIRETLSIEDLEDITQNKKKEKVEIKGDKDKLDQYLSELQKLTGLDEVKEGIEKLVSSLKIARIRKERGLQIINKPLHAIFTGNPGTGKTTVARLMSNIFRELGVLSKGQLVEVDRAQLVAGYTGQTAIKTDEVIQKALGGTLFIDEAYTLARGSNDFGQEAIETLLKRMEDFNGEFVVIAAGYTNEMQNFLETNPGLTSRFTNNFHFEDYTPEQLLNIAESMAKANNYSFSNDGSQALLEKFRNLYQSRDKNFGNARTARNVFLQIITNQEERIAELLNPSDSDLQTLRESDVR